MKIRYETEVRIPKNSMFVQLEGLTGCECHDKYGLKQGECETLSLTLPHGKRIDLKICVSDEDVPCFSECILFNEDGVQESLTEPSDSVMGEWCFEDLQGSTYTVIVKTDGRVTSSIVSTACYANYTPKVTLEQLENV